MPKQPNIVARDQGFHCRCLWLLISYDTVLWTYNANLTELFAHGGQGLSSVYFEVPPSWPTAMPFLPNSNQPEQNWADSGTNKLKATKPSL